MSSTGTVPLRLTQVMGQRQQKRWGGGGGGEAGRTDVTSLSHTHNPEIDAEAEEQPTTHHLTAAKSWQKEEWLEGFLHLNRVSHKCSQTKKEKKVKIK